MKNEHVIIIGGGAAGLAAALALSEKMKVTLLEAAPLSGGRINTVREGGINFEYGAEFIHGDLPITLRLLKRAGIKKTAVSGNMYRYQNGVVTAEENMTEDWHQLMQKMKGLAADTTVDVFLNKFFRGKKYESLRTQVKQYAEGYDLADTSKASVAELYREWNNENEHNYRINKGYSALVRFMAKQARQQSATLLMRMKVKEISWANGFVRVSCSNRKSFVAKKVLITVPLHGIASKSIRIHPPIKKYETAAAQIGFGNVIKVMLLFTESFWKKDSMFIFTDGLFRTWWTQLPDKTPMLTGWLGGPRAKMTAATTKAQILTSALGSLSKTFGITVSSLRKKIVTAHISNPQQNSHIAGGCSYATPKSAAAKALLSTPIEETIFFAGEGLYEGESPGTVEAALHSGTEAAKRIAKGR